MGSIWRVAEEGAWGREKAETDVPSPAAGGARIGGLEINAAVIGASGAYRVAVIEEKYSSLRAGSLNDDSRAEETVKVQVNFAD